LIVFADIGSWIIQRQSQAGNRTRSARVTAARLVVRRVSVLAIDSMLT
jgi:hypothetical protein